MRTRVIDIVDMKLRPVPEMAEIAFARTRDKLKGSWIKGQYSMLCARNNYFAKLWIDIQTLKPIMGDLFTYGSFVVLVLTCGGMNLGIGIRAKTIIQTIGALCTVGSMALKVSSKISVVKIPMLFQVPKLLDPARANRAINLAIPHFKHTFHNKIKITKECECYV